MRERCLFVAMVYAVVCITNIQSVSFINKCKSDDSKCLTESAQVAIPIIAAGLPEYNLKPLDPIYLERIDSSTPDLKYILTDLTVTGVKNCTLEEVKRDKSKSKLFMTFLCSTNTVGQYEMKGQLLNLPIEGKGPINIKLRRAQIKVNADLEEQNDKWNTKNWKYSVELKDKSEVIYENLFNGNEALGKATRDVIAKHGNDIVTNFGLQVIAAVGDVILEEVNKFFHAVSAKELSID